MTSGSTTRVLGVVGWPVAHSLSPAMHGAAIRALGLDLVYLPFAVAPASLAAALTGARALGIRGLNLTVPHKIAALPLLDALTPAAARAGSVNTVVFEGGRALGDTTDGPGYLASLAEEHGFRPRGATVVVLGAGGAARAIAVALADAGALSIAIHNRDAGRAHTLGALLSRIAPTCRVSAAGLGGGPLWQPDSPPDLVVQTTTVGMSKVEGTREFAEAEALFGHLVPSAPATRTLCSDIVYVPEIPPFIRVARRLGAPVHGGLGMLVHQGALAFRLFTGVDAPIDVMRRAAADALV